MSTATMPVSPTGCRVYQFGGYGVDVKLTSHATTTSIWWSPRRPSGGGFNSYVLAAKPGDEKPTLCSINGVGEIRWIVEDWQRDSIVRTLAEGKALVGDQIEEHQALVYFGLL